MSVNRLVKVLVIVFSVTAGGLLVWQLKKNISGESTSQLDDESEGNEESGGAALAIGPKSPGGSLNMGEHFSPDKKNKPSRPLMSGSKTRVDLVLEEVDEAWELAVPPLEENEAEEKGSDEAK